MRSFVSLCSKVQRYPSATCMNVHSTDKESEWVHSLSCINKIRAIVADMYWFRRGSGSWIYSTGTSRFLWIRRSDTGTGSECIIELPIFLYLVCIDVVPPGTRRTKNIAFVFFYTVQIIAHRYLAIKKRSRKWPMKRWFFFILLLWNPLPVVFHNADPLIRVFKSFKVLLPVPKNPSLS